MFRLSLAEQLNSTLLLDDQLTQTDAARMAWLRAMILEVAQRIQVIVFTCRAADYLGTLDAGGPVRSVDLGRAIHRSG